MELTQNLDYRTSETAPHENFNVIPKFFMDMSSFKNGLNILRIKEDTIITLKMIYKSCKQCVAYWVKSCAGSLYMEVSLYSG